MCAAACMHTYVVCSSVLTRDCVLNVRVLANAERHLAGRELSVALLLALIVVGADDERVLWLGFKGMRFRV